MKGRGSFADNDPVRLAQEGAKQKLPKRFYERAELCRADEGYQIKLDGRSVKTSAGARLAVKPEAYAKRILEEWRRQKTHIDPADMPHTRLAGAAIDGAASAAPYVVEAVAAYAGSDLVCYRASGPAGLASLQSRHFDPLLEHARTRYGARFYLAEGVMPVTQPAQSVARIKQAAQAFVRDPLALAGLHAMTHLTGSVLIALAAADKTLSVKAAWAAAHVDEDWNISQWGQDAEAAKRRARLLCEFEAAYLAASGLLGA